MVYHPVSIGPTDGQLSDLAQGEEIKLSHKHLQGDVTLHLTTAQMKRLSAAFERGKGCTLKFSAAQLKHMGQHGSGRFTDLLMSGYNYLKPKLQKGLKDGLNYAADKGQDFVRGKVDEGIDYAKKKGQAYLDDGIDYAAKKGKAYVDDGLGYATNKIAGMAGLRGKGWQSDAAKYVRATNVDDGLIALGKQHGKGWLGDMGKFLGHAAVDGVAKLAGVGIKKPRPATRRKQQGQGWLGDMGKFLGHAAVDGIANLAGGEINPLVNNNERMRAALFQKKMTGGTGGGKGGGLRM